MRRRRSCATRREHGVEVRPADVNLSDWDCTLEDTPAPSGVLQTRHAAMKGDIRTHARAAPRLPPDQRVFRGRTPCGSNPCAGAASNSVRDLWLRTEAAARRAGAARQCRRVQLARPVTARRALGGARAAARGRQGRPAAVRARRDAGARAGRRAPADAAGRAGGRGLSPSASVAEGASGVVPARRSRPARHHAARASAGHRLRRARHGRGARAGAPAARARRKA